MENHSHIAAALIQRSIFPRNANLFTNRIDIDGVTLAVPININGLGHNYTTRHFK